MKSAGIRQSFDDAEEVHPLAPLPLERSIPPAADYPLAALGAVLGGAAEAIVDIVQCPAAIAAQSVLAAASLAVQSHFDVIHPVTGKPRPTSLFLVTVAVSGERKSTADEYALQPVRHREDQLRKVHVDDCANFKNQEAAFKKARQTVLNASKGLIEETTKSLGALGEEPRPPRSPIILATEPTLEGLHKQYAEGQPSMGLFSDEGGGFVGGHGMRDEYRLRMITGLSDLWDGKPVTRVRATDGSSILPGRRLALHLMLQPGVSDALLANSQLEQQGILSRILVSAPASLIGTRMQREHKAESLLALRNYESVMIQMLSRKPQSTDSGELRPQPLTLDERAKDLWRAFSDEVEGDLREGERLQSIRGFAAKLPEHVLRIAGVLQALEKPEILFIDSEVLLRAIEAGRYYSEEALRLFGASQISKELQVAQKLLNWLHQKGHAEIALQEVYQRGPAEFREAKRAREAMAVLAEHGWAKPIRAGLNIDGKRCREAWAIQKVLS